ncbi:hypothetical protein [Rhizobium sp. 18065]|uniref:hypothetical protein n=1 Tax=Rhizobium sp. 18065 TaxID=2681411 RepID=UPI00135B6938|nr:hypothetical protein [Rhizobium sp. 18065]
MAWDTKYWDILDQIYWWPRYSGYRSISQRHWIRESGRVSIPEEMVNPSGPLYSRERKADELRDYLLGSEEILNHLFDLTFSIAPDALIRDLFLQPLGFEDTGSFESIGRETAARYGWGKSENITQHDGLFISERSAVAIELKLRSSSWPEQIAKYAAILAWEELAFGEKDNLGLMFIVPQNAIAGHWKKCGLNGPVIESTWLDREWRKGLPKSIEHLFVQERAAVRSVVDRLTLNVMSWSELYAALQMIGAGLDQADAGQQTLYRLIRGFLSQLERHRETGIDT